MAADSLPLFPLDTVLFPGGPLALRIFEARYLDLMRRCLKEQSGFGVVQILEGAEAGAVAAIAEVGTVARVVDFDTLPDGLLGVSCRGERRFKVLRRWLQEDGLNMGEIDYLPEDLPGALPGALAHLGELLRELLPRIGGPYAQLDAHFADAGWVANRWAEILPLSVAQRLQLLLQDDPAARLAQVAQWSQRQLPAARV
jgi:uncharacterized protein